VTGSGGNGSIKAKGKGLRGEQDGHGKFDPLKIKEKDGKVIEKKKR